MVVVGGVVVKFQHWKLKTGLIDSGHVWIGHFLEMLAIVKKKINILDSTSICVHRDSDCIDIVLVRGSDKEGQLDLLSKAWGGSRKATSTSTDFNRGVHDGVVPGPRIA